MTMTATAKVEPRHYSTADLSTRYFSLCHKAVISATFTSELVGGQTADEKGIRGFVLHHLKLTGLDAAALHPAAAPDQT